VSRPGDPRRVAYELLRAVHEDDAYANLLLPARIARAGLTGSDAAFATELGYGTLRMAGYYDLVIAQAAGRPIARLDPPVVELLRLGAHQLLALGTASHAAVNETVALARRTGSARAAGLVNAVLRRIAERSAEEWREAVAAGFPDPDDAAAAVAAHPRWIVDALRAALAAEGAAEELPALLDADNRNPSVNYAVVPFAQVDVSGFAPDRYSPHGFTGVPRERLGGTVRVQDEGSQLAALALVGARPVEAGERWLDLCAGPGGKAVLLAAYARHHGALLTANEIVPARAGLVRRALVEAGLDDAVVTERDGRDYAAEPGSYDRILLDAPCTGLGALRRRPEARWRRSPADLATLTVLQAELLDAAVAALKPGGLLAYVTCSPHLAETRDQLQGALERNPGLRTVPTRPALDAVTLRPLELPAEGDHVQLWPHRHGSDAMFVQLLTTVDPSGARGRR